MNKKGAYDLGRKAIYLILVIFFLTIIFIYLNTTFAQFDLAVLDTAKDASAATLMSELLYSAHCFTYYDKDIDRSYPGIIDVKKINNKTIYKSCGKFYKDKFAVYVFTGQLANRTKYLTSAKYLNAKLSDLKNGKEKKSKVYRAGRASINYTKALAEPIVLQNGDKQERGVIVLGYA